MVNRRLVCIQSINEIHIFQVRMECCHWPSTDCTSHPRIMEIATSLHEQHHQKLVKFYRWMFTSFSSLLIVVCWSTMTLLCSLVLSLSTWSRLSSNSLIFTQSALGPCSLKPAALRFLSAKHLLRAAASLSCWIILSLCSWVSPLSLSSCLHCRSFFCKACTFLPRISCDSFNSFFPISALLNPQLTPVPVLVVQNYAQSI